MCFPMEAEPREVPGQLSCLPRPCHRKAGGAVGHAFHLPVIVQNGIPTGTKRNLGAEGMVFCLPRGFLEDPLLGFFKDPGPPPPSSMAGKRSFHCGN